MRGADSVAGTIKSGGKTRRAAKMVVLDIDHPDIQEFIWCKAKEEKKAWVLEQAGYDMSLDCEAMGVDPVPEREQLGARDGRVHGGGRRRRGMEPHGAQRRDGGRDARGAEAAARDRRGDLAVRRSGHAVRHDHQSLAHDAEDGPDQCVEPVLAST